MCTQFEFRVVCTSLKTFLGVEKDLNDLKECEMIQAYKKSFKSL